MGWNRLKAAALSLLVTAFLVGFLPPALGQITEPPDGIFGEYRRRARDWWDEFNRFRMEQGLPSMVWSEKMYIVLVEYAKEIRKFDPDADGLPSPAERPTRRARRVHKWNISFMDNPSTSYKETYSARESIERFGGVKLIRSIRDANQNVGAVAIVERKNKKEVYVVEAVSRLNIEKIIDVQQKVSMANAFLSMSDQAERLRAVKELAVLGDISTIFILFPLLRDKNPDVAREAMRGLSLLRDPCLVEPLISYMYVVEGDMKSRIAGHLAALTGRKDLGTDHLKWRRWWEQQSGVLPEKKPVKPIVAPGKTDLNEDEIDELVGNFRKQYKEADGMGKVDAIRSIAAVKHKKVAKALLSGLGSRDPMVRKAAAEALKTQADKSTTGKLVTALAKEVQEDIKILLIEALGEIGDPRAVPAITKDLVRPGQPAVTKAKIVALGKIRDKRCIEALIDFMWKWGRGSRDFRRELHTALTTLTGKDYGNDRRAWKDWWERTKKWFRFPKEK
jgi:HEAT repeat protein